MKRKKSRKSIQDNKVKSLTFDKMPKFDNNALPIIWADVIRFVVRQSGTSTLKFYAQFPDHAVEQARIQIANTHLNRIIDTLTQITDYYPVKQLKKSKKK